MVHDSRYTNQTVFPRDRRFFGEDGSITVESSDLDWSPCFWPPVIVVGGMEFVKGRPLATEEENEFEGYIYTRRN